MRSYVFLLVCIIVLFLGIKYFESKTDKNISSLNRYTEIELYKTKILLLRGLHLYGSDSNYVQLKEYFEEIELDSLKNYDSKMRDKILRIHGLKPDEINSFQSNLSLIRLFFKDIFPVNFYYPDSQRFKLVIEDIKSCCNGDGTRLKFYLFYQLPDNEYTTFYLNDNKLDSLPDYFYENKLSGLKAVYNNPVTKESSVYSGQ